MEPKDLPARERRRTIEALPQTSEPGNLGCIAWLLPWLAGCLLLGWQTGSWVFPAAAALPAILLLSTLLQQEVYARLLVWRARREFLARGVRFVVIYSDSARWRQHIESSWLTRFDNQAVTLNWSERDRWPNSLAVRLFNTFVKRERNYTPAVMVLRRNGKPLVFRFYYAFKQLRAGRRGYLHRLEQDMFRYLDDEASF